MGVLRDRLQRVVPSPLAQVKKMRVAFAAILLALAVSAFATEEVNQGAAEKSSRAIDAVAPKVYYARQAAPQQVAQARDGAHHHHHHEHAAPAPAAYEAAPVYEAAPSYEAAPAPYEAAPAAYEAPAPAPAYSTPGHQGYYYYYYPVKDHKAKLKLPKFKLPSLPSFPSLHLPQSYGKDGGFASAKTMGMAAATSLLVAGGIF